MWESMTWNTLGKFGGRPGLRVFRSIVTNVGLFSPRARNSSLGLNLQVACEPDEKLAVMDVWSLTYSRSVRFLHYTG